MRGYQTAIDTFGTVAYVDGVEAILKRVAAGKSGKVAGKGQAAAKKAG
jgi:hypothetical protein